MEQEISGDISDETVQTIERMHRMSKTIEELRRDKMVLEGQLAAAAILISRLVKTTAPSLISDIEDKEKRDRFTDFGLDHAQTGDDLILLGGVQDFYDNVVRASKAD